MLIGVLKSPRIKRVIVELHQEDEQARADMEEKDGENCNEDDTLDTRAELHRVAKVRKDCVLALEKLEKLGEAAETDEFVELADFGETEQGIGAHPRLLEGVQRQYGNQVDPEPEAKVLLSNDFLISLNDLGLRVNRSR